MQPEQQLQTQEYDYPSLSHALVEGALIGTAVGLGVAAYKTGKFFTSRSYRIRELKEVLKNPRIREGVQRKAEEIFQKKLEGKKGLSPLEIKKLRRETRKEAIKRHILKGLKVAAPVVPILTGPIVGMGVSGAHYVLERINRIIQFYDSTTYADNEQRNIDRPYYAKIVRYLTK